MENFKKEIGLIYELIDEIEDLISHHEKSSCHDNRYYPKTYIDSIFKQRGEDEKNINTNNNS